MAVCSLPLDGGTSTLASAGRHLRSVLIAVITSTTTAGITVPLASLTGDRFLADAAIAACSLLLLTAFLYIGIYIGIVFVVSR